jgi:homoserine O-acetyltransferase
VKAGYRLATEQFGIEHLQAVIGFSMAAQQAFQWAVSYPTFADAIVPYCGTAKEYPAANRFSSPAGQFDTRLEPS